MEEYEIVADKFNCPFCGSEIKVKILPIEGLYPLKGDVRVNCKSCKASFKRRYN